jgi:hypothetical protein
MSRRPIFMISAEGKSKEQLSREAWAAIQKWQEAQANQESDAEPKPE